MPTITLHGRQVEYSVTRSRRSRYVRLTVALGTGLRVSAPLRVGDRDVLRVIREKSEWVLRKLDEFDEIRRRIPRQSWRSGARVLFLGRRLTLRIGSHERSRSRVVLHGEELQMTIPGHVTGEGREALLRRLLHAWYGVQARKLIPRRVALHAARMGVSPSRISIRRQRSRWGSCSSSGALSFNQALMLVPPAVLDYVIVHELSHLVELNHSRHFWSMVDAHCPGRREHQAWLRSHSYYLDV